MSSPPRGKRGFERGAPRPRSMSLSVFDTGLLILCASHGDVRILEAWLSRKCFYRESSGEFRRGGRPRRRSPARAVDMLLQVPQGWLTSILMAWEAWTMEDELEVMFADGVRRNKVSSSEAHCSRALGVGMGEESECERAIPIRSRDI